MKPFNKNTFTGLFVLVVNLVLLFSSITVVYNLLAYEVLELGPRYVDTWRCDEPRDIKGELVSKSKAEREECLNEALAKAQSDLDREIKHDYAWSLSALIIGLPLLWMFRKKD